MTDNFAEALGLQELVERTSGRPAGEAEDRTALSSSSASAPTPPAAPPAPPIDPRIVEQFCKLMDSMVSAFAGVEPEEDVSALAASVQPLMEHYSGGANPIAAMWIMAGIGLASYGLAKYQKYRVAHPAKPKAMAGMADVDGHPVDLREVAEPPADRMAA